MVDETDISREKKWFYQERARLAVANLNKRNINAQRVSNRQEALEAILAIIPEGAVVARADSVTLEQIGIIPELRKGNRNAIIYPLEHEADGSYVIKEVQQRRQATRETFFSDVFLTGTNAVTLDGKLVNIDGFGNRVAAMLFGPDKVIVVAGANKIVKDTDEALERIHQFAAPMNARRHYLKHHREEFADLPCVRTGKCVDCNHDWKICRYTVIIDGTLIREKGRLNVVLVEEELGL